MRAIAEILGLLEESGKGKDWVLQELKKHKFKIGTNSAKNTFEILKICPLDLVTHLLNVLKNDDFEDFQDIKTLTKTFHWFFTDIVGSANPAILTKDQARKVWALNELLRRTETFRNKHPTQDVMTITGDGMVIGFNDSPQKPFNLAMELHKVLSKYNQSRKFHDKLKLRIGIDTGPVYFIKDVTGKDNFWGPGIIMARRIMDLARPMQILASSKIANDVANLSPDYKSAIHSIGEYKIKHGDKLSICNVYGKGWGNKMAPRPGPDTKKETVPQQFLFPKVKLELEIKDLKNMMTHHTWLWNIVNITDQPSDNVSYFIDGDIPKEFADLNVKLTDEENRKLKILSINQNKPTSKQFVVQLKKPIKPGQKRRFVKLEYDWEEPERNFHYVLATDCKKFEYRMTVPKGFETKPRVLKVNPGTKTLEYATPASKIRYLKNRTEVTWNANNLQGYGEYRFEW